MDVYKSVLELSEIKEDPYATPEQVSRVQMMLEKSLAAVSYVSEAQRLTRFSWWSTEYGLFKEKDRFLIFGAGLLSSVGESYSCLSDEVEKKYLDLQCVEQSFDITRPQPQLFYVHSFKEMEAVVDELSNTMAYKIGGRLGLEKALQAKTVTTTQLESGLQIGGVVEMALFDEKDQPIFIKWSGPVQLGVRSQQIEGHGPLYHREGFSSPFGKIKGIYHASHLMNANDLEQMQLFPGGVSCVEFESGFKVEGEFKSVFKFDCFMLLISFSNAKVTYKNKIYFDPSWGDFDMALGSEMKSVYGGAPDREKYFIEVPPEIIKKRKQKNNLTPQNQKLNELYFQIRKIRDEQLWSEKNLKTVMKVTAELDQFYPADWLLRLEILELIKKRSELIDLEKSLRLKLETISQESKKNKMLIERGLKLFEPVGD